MMLVPEVVEVELMEYWSLLGCAYSAVYKYLQKLMATSNDVVTGSHGFRV
jgi:hypothetical protein